MGYKDPERQREYSRQYHLEHKEEKHIYDKEYGEKNREMLNRKAHQYYVNNKEIILAKGKEWRKHNLLKTREYSKQRRVKARYDCISYYSKGMLRCNCCKEDIYEFLTIDHINGGGKAQWKAIGGTYGFYLWIIKNKFPEEFQVLCWNCNCARAKNNGICPHKQRQPLVIKAFRRYTRTK